LVHANLLNASQVALGAMAGVVLFDEPRNAWLVTGIVLTVLGILFTGRPPTDEEQALESV
jgi:drug/metabolite transporter (DMT)-like permease